MRYRKTVSVPSVPVPIKGSSTSSIDENTKPYSLAESFEQLQPVGAVLHVQSRGYFLGCLPYCVRDSIRLISLHPVSTPPFPVYFALPEGQVLREPGGAIFLLARPTHPFPKGTSLNYFGQVSIPNKGDFVVYTERDCFSVVETYDGYSSPHALRVTVGGDLKDLVLLCSAGKGNFGQGNIYADVTQMDKNDPVFSGSTLPSNFDSQAYDKYVLKLPLFSESYTPQQHQGSFLIELNLSSGLRRSGLVNLMEASVCLGFLGQIHRGFWAGLYPYIQGETLQNVVQTKGAFSALELSQLMQGLVKSVIGELHAQRCVHLDLNGGNVMRGPNGYYLVDMGTMRHLDMNPVVFREGLDLHFSYVPPEFDLNMSVAEGYDYRNVDLWQMGVLFVTALFGFNPFTKSKEDVLDWISTLDSISATSIKSKYSSHQVGSDLGSRLILGEFLSVNGLQDRVIRLRSLVDVLIRNDLCKETIKQVPDVFFEWISRFLAPKDERILLDTQYGDLKTKFNQDMQCLESDV